MLKEELLKLSHDELRIIVKEEGLGIRISDDDKIEDIAERITDKRNANIEHSVQDDIVRVVDEKSHRNKVVNKMITADINTLSSSELIKSIGMTSKILVREKNYELLEFVIARVKDAKRG